MTADRELSVEERLRIGGYAAPRIRPDTGRRVKTYDPKTLKTTGEVSLRAVQEEILKRADIEFSLDPSEERRHQKICAGDRGPCPNAVRVPDGACSPKRIAWRLRNGDGYWRCRPCISRAAHAAKTPEQRRWNTRKARAAVAPERRREKARKINAALTAEQRSDRSRKGRATRRERAAR